MHSEDSNPGTAQGAEEQDVRPQGEACADEEQQMIKEGYAFWINNGPKTIRIRCAISQIEARQAARDKLRRLPKSILAKHDINPETCTLTFKPENFS